MNHRVWTWMRIAVAVVWLAWAVLAWWTAPRESDAAHARADLAADLVIGYQWGDSWQNNGWAVFSVRSMRSDGLDGPLFAWRTTDGRTHWVDTGREGLQVPVAGTVDASRFTGPAAVSIGESVAAAGDPAGSLRLPFSPVAGLLLGLGFLWVLVNGPSPRVGTKWFWFWVVLLVPVGLGLLVYLWRERPRLPATALAGAPAAPGAGATALSPDATALTPDTAATGPAPPSTGAIAAERPRRNGWFGFGLGLLIGITGSVLLAVLHALAGNWLVPLP